MAIAFDSATDGSNNGGSGSSHTVSFNNVAGNLIIAAVAGDSSVDNITGCTWNGVAMTQLAKLTNAQTSNGRYNHYFYILSAATGTHNIVASAGSSHFIGICAASYSGVDTTGQPDASTTNTGSSAADLTTSLTTIADNCWAILAEFAYAGGSAPSAGAGTVRRAKDPADGGFGIFDGNGPKTPAGSVSLNTTQAFTVAIGHIMASFKPTGGAVLAATITTPTSSATYDNGTTSTITLGGTTTAATSVTWANDRGGSGSATNTGTSYSTWSITGISLTLGANVITVTAGDGSTTVTDTITVAYSSTFPTTSVIDNFNRTENPLSDGGKWSSPIAVGDDPAQTNGTRCIAAGTYAEAYRNDQTYGPNSEVHITVITKSTATDSFFNLTIRTKDENSAVDGYAASYQGDLGQWTLNRFDNEAATELVRVSHALNNNDKIGLQIIGSLINLWRYDSGGSAWEKVTWAVDATYSLAGHIGMEFGGAGAGWVLDDFGGGTISTLTPVIFTATDSLAGGELV